jgi:hypothetical protein
MIRFHSLQLILHSVHWESRRLLVPVSDAPSRDWKIQRNLFDSIPPSPSSICALDDSPSLSRTVTTRSFVYRSSPISTLQPICNTHTTHEWNAVIDSFLGCLYYVSVERSLLKAKVEVAQAPNPVELTHSLWYSQERYERYLATAPKSTFTCNLSSISPLEPTLAGGFWRDSL